MTQYVQIQFGTLPLILTLFSDRSVALTPLQPFKTVVDVGESNKVFAVLDMEGVSLYNNKLFEAGEDLLYNTRYYIDDSEILLAYLKQQKITI